MKKFFVLLFFVFTFFSSPIYGEEDKVLTAGISVNEVPKELFGSWKVVAKLDDTDNYRLFKPQSSDLWTLSRVGNVITLTNPFSGAEAQVSLKAVEGNLIIFSKESPYNTKTLTDTVSIRLSKNNFSGINTISLKSYSSIDGHVIKTENARYIIKGEKISGDDVL